MSAARLEVSSPYDGSRIETLPLITKAQAQAMLEQAHILFKNRDKWLAPYQRIEILNRIADLLSQRADQFAVLIAKEGGKPLTDAHIEVARAIDGIHLAAKELSHIMRGEEIPMGYTAASTGRRAYTSYEPIGVVIAVSAFNHPLNLIVHQIIPAIATGCPVIVKPALTTPLNCKAFVELVHEAGLPDRWCQLCICDNDVAELLVTSDKIAFFSFIGSAQIGWYLKAKLAPGVRCALEHGGAAPVIVDKTADFGKLIGSLLKGGFYHAGQVCVSVQRVYVDETILDDVASALTAGAKKLSVGDPTLAETDIGPLILPREVNRVAQWVDAAIAEGATCLTGGIKISDTVYAPTILLNPSPASQVSRAEIFGPVICLYAYADRREAIARANALDYAFQAAVYTQDLDIAHECIKYLDATAIMVNDHTAFRVDWMPFAGRRASGYGVGGIGYTMHDMVQPKMAVFRIG